MKLAFNVNGFYQESLVKIFPGVPHGWTVRYKDDDEFAVKMALEAQQDLLDWLKKILMP